MGPENAARMCSAIPLKELSWIDRMYQKLENICVEVDKNPTLLIQETSKYVESQMNVVGSNVKKLCAELIYDLLPPPVDKKFDCPLHCKCDCTDLEKPKQKEAGIQLSKDTGSVRTEENFAEVDMMHCEIGDIELKNLMSLKMSKQNINIDNTVIMNEGTKSIDVTRENEEQLGPPVIMHRAQKNIHSQGNERDDIFVSQVSIPREYGKQDDISKEEHVGSYGAHAGNVAKMQPFESWAHEYGDCEESELTTKSEDVCGQGSVVHTDIGDKWRILHEDRSFQIKMEQEQTETTEALLCSNLSIIGSTAEEPNLVDPVGEFFASEMDDDVMPMYGSEASTKSAGSDTISMDNSRASTKSAGTAMISMHNSTSSTKSAGTAMISMHNSRASTKSRGEKLNEITFSRHTNDLLKNKHPESPQGENYMMVSASNDGDEEQSARWLVSESQRNIFQQHENSSFHRRPNHLEELESDWEFV